MTRPPRTLPPDVAAIIGDAPRRVVAHRWRAVVEQVGLDPVLYLKYAPCDDVALRQEAERLAWLADISEETWFPRVLLQTESYGWRFVVRSGLRGMDLAAWANMHGVRAAIDVQAAALRALADIPVDDCPFEVPTAWLLEVGRQSVVEGVDPEWIESNEPGRSAADLLAEAQRLCPTVHPPAFVHGDFYHDNLIVDDGGAWGLIDWGWAGRGDRHRDLSKAYATTRLAWGREWADRLLEVVDLDHDADALRGFIALHPLL